MMIEQNRILKDLCSYRTGGAAEFYAAVQTDDELAEALAFAAEKGLEITILGGGYNVLISDKGVSGIVINTAGLNCHTTVNGTEVYAGAGIMIDDLAEMTAQAGLCGMEDMSGIPGTVGGAVRMNAGAFATEIKDIAVCVDMMDWDGRRYRVQNADAGFGYRRADGLKGVVTGAMFRLKQGEPEAIKVRRAEILAKRDEKQPLDFPSCGSVFKRPEGNYAGTLIEKCGLKGFRIGGAVVSEKHANFILNVDNAASDDIYSLILHVQDTVEKETGIRLEREVRFIGF
ncbi:UDP-N-acetylmuramate dehydrogenase [Seleniivibrio woodruffii]|uniref:UDP-N-acetylenolpyruvoylglucosamine reductase n=1 Tax=Seleniivibrio woodruffii TaxID=1078050 RepID=A0A4R1K5Q2_9BACT|nr:UDP-N-acetylmuramate dehydrogenase [Seleniivibrio woodruffii]TCK59526.1 UDP-N-acetylmuramate dehydrogenase [Seleniivibrio woodruffii]TVZ35433.1 UDP-N-acetylmuramate dehydrogenase [Seleniivibrio woodruffii]